MVRKPSLPSERSEPSRNLWDYTYLIYGAKKVGKTSLCAEIPNCLQLMTEPGAKALSAYYRTISKWLHFGEYLSLLEQDETFQVVAVDTVDRLYGLCYRYICKQAGVDHPGEVAYSRVWSQIRSEFDSAILRLLSLGKGVIFISHDRFNEITRRDGSTYSQLGPTMSGQATDIIAGLCDVIAYYGYEGSERKLYIRGDDFISAGCRIEQNFLTKKGEPIVAIPMGESKEVSYRNLIRAFENRQVNVGSLPLVQKPSKGKKKSGL